MIKIEQADSDIAKALVPTSASEKLPLARALHRTLARPVCADRAYPPFDRVAMDGVAVRSSDLENGQREFLIAFVQRAGEAERSLPQYGVCAEVMTGAVLPEGSDVVIPFERLDIRDNRALVKTEEFQKRQNIHSLGSDCTDGATLLRVGQFLTSPRLAVAASVGATELEVYRTPRIAIVSTGDELVDLEQTPAAFQIRSSNAPALRALFQAFGLGETSLFNLADDQKILHERLTQILAEFDCVVLSGGVSMGKFDFVPQALADAKVRKVFHKIAQKPGKPIWFGVGSREQLVFGLPGNPVSALICARRFVVPNLRRWARLPELEGQKVALAHELRFEKDLTWFPGVRISASGLAEKVETNGSGDFISLSQSDGFLELPAERSHFVAQESCLFYGWERGK